MALAEQSLSFGFARVRKEAGERRDFLPALVRGVAALGASVVVEHGIGSGMGYVDQDYLGPRVRVGGRSEVFDQEVVVTLRAPEEDLTRMRPGATLVAMLHFPTRPGRVLRLIDLEVEAISLDLLTDDLGNRLVENMRAVAWNGLDAAFDALQRTYPMLTDPARPPVRVTVMGAGAVGRHAVEAATKYGSLERNDICTKMDLPGVEVVSVGRNFTCRFHDMLERLRATDILVDATQRSDPSRPVVPNDWIACLPAHAVICDLTVDPYLLDAHPAVVRGIEGIPQGNLDQYRFEPEDPAWDRLVPAEIPSRHRRTVVSCYSWPGVHPEACMEHYGRQLAPLLRALVRSGGVRGLRVDGGLEERALHRASLGAWYSVSVEAEDQAVAAVIGL